jgi:hypothetical protein
MELRKTGKVSGQSVVLAKLKLQLGTHKIHNSAVDMWAVRYCGVLPKILNI